MTNANAGDLETGWIPEMDLADRLRKTLRQTDIGVSDMAARMGVARETIGTWINGRITPRRPALVAWATITGCDLEWLETGRARRDSNSQPSDLYPSALERAAIRWGLAA